MCHWRLGFILIFAFSVIGTTASACRYTVRDVAFVDLDRTAYQLYAFVDASTNEEWRNNFSVMAGATLIDTNVQSHLIDVDAEPSHAAIDFFDAARRGSEIKTPAVIVVNPAGRVLHLADFTPTWSNLETVIQSPSRKAVMEPIFESYAVVLLIEGKSKAGNELARQSVDGAIEQINGMRHTMPKPVRVGPKLVTIKAADRERERVLLWSLGVEEQAGDDPSVVVLLGRGRKIGPTITGPAIVQTDVFDVLHVIGQDCECGLDRKWMQGDCFPYTFGDDFRDAVKQHVGFDPQDDAVIAEMNRILAKGPVPAVDLATGIPRDADRIDPLLGYRESTVGAGADASTGAAGSVQSSSSANASSSSVSSHDGAAGASGSERVVWQIAGVVLGGLVLIAVIGSVWVRRRALSTSSVS